MTDINDLVQEFWRISNDGAVGVVGASFFAMRRLFEILQKSFDFLEVCFNIISVCAIVVDLADKNPQKSANPNSWNYLTQSDQIRAKFKILFNGYRKMFDQLFLKSKDLGDMLKFLPGVVVQNHSMSMQGMADLYRINPDLLERLVKFTIEPLKPFPSRYMLDDYLSGLLQDRDRSQLNYCDPTLQHISICRHFLLLDGPNAFDLQS